MKNLRLLLTPAFAAVLAATSPASETGFKSLFNGKDLTGWEGQKDFWSVREGAITGRTTAEKPLKSNTFLVWKDGTPANFELRAQFRLTAQNDKNQANSGVQYRSKVLDPVTFVVGGYQADIDSTGKYSGMLYEEKGRGILMGPGDKIRIGPIPAGQKKAAVEKLGTATPAAEILAAYKLGEWNEIVIIAKSGVLALQLHQGPPMTIQFKNVRLRTLP
jgi:hypothetical protein